MILSRIDKSYQYFYSLLFVILVSSVCYGLSGYLPYRVVALILLLSVSLIAMLFEIAPVLVASIASALIWDYFFIPPRFNLSVGTGEDTLMLIMYFVIASVNATLTYKIRLVEKRAMREEGRANTIKLYNTLLNSLSHELRTPISTIIGSTDNLLINSDKLTSTLKTDLLNEISKASLRLNYQVENLLNMSRLESGVLKLNKDWCDVNDLIYSVVNKLEDELSKHKIIVNVPEKFPLFKIDFGLMERALFNLITNAALYTPEGSTITISAGETEKIIKDGADIEKIGEELVLSVSDNGAGFPQDEVDRIFEKFYRLKNSRTGGTGLGLSIVKGFVEAHKGRITLANLPKGGARFTMHIPAKVSFIQNLKNE